MNIEIKIADLSDLDKLHEIKLAAFRPLYEIYQDEASPYKHTKNHMATRMNRLDCDYYKILCDSEICGGAAVYKVAVVYNWLAIIYISPFYQNKKIAQTAISLLFDKYPFVKKWGLDFPIDMLPNRKCYEKLGFTDTHKREIINEKLTLAVYEKSFV